MVENGSERNPRGTSPGDAQREGWGGGDRPANRSAANHGLREREAEISGFRLKMILLIFAQEGECGRHLRLPPVELYGTCSCVTHTDRIRLACLLAIYTYICIFPRSISPMMPESLLMQHCRSPAQHIVLESSSYQPGFKTNVS